MEANASLLIAFPEKVEVRAKGKNSDGIRFYPGDVLILSSNNEPVGDFAGHISATRLYEFIKEGSRPSKAPIRGNTFLTLLEISFLTGEKVKLDEKKPKPKKTVFSRRSQY